MSQLASSSLVSIHKLPPSIQSSKPQHSVPRKPFRFQSRTRHFPTLLCCQANPKPVDSITKEDVLIEPGSGQDNNSDQATIASQNVELAQFPNKNINRRIAVGSTVAAVGLFLSTRLDFGVSLKDLSAAAMPYEEALSNGKPTVVEFYADWCEVCRELAPDVYKVEQQFKDRVNFVMLNVDNTKWEQELDEFGVEGIPHFAFLDKKGNEEGNVVGRLPRQYLLENVDALVQGEASIPHARVVGQYSSAEARKVHRVVDPRSHGEFLFKGPGNRSMQFFVLGQKDSRDLS